MGMVDPAQWEWGADEQTPHHPLQTCPLFEEARQLTCGEDTPIHEKLWGQAGDLYQTVQFNNHTKLTIKAHPYMIERKRRRRRRRITSCRPMNIEETLQSYNNAWYPVSRNVRVDTIWYRQQSIGYVFVNLFDRELYGVNFIINIVHAMCAYG